MGRGGKSARAGALGTGIAYVLNYRIIQDEGPIAASVVTYLLPIVAVILGWAVLREAVTVAILAGVVLVLGGVILSKRTRSGVRSKEVAE